MSDIVTLVANSGGTLGLAIFAIWMLNKVWEARLKEEIRNTEQVTQMWKATTKALNDNTEVITKLLENKKND